MLKLSHISWQVQGNKILSDINLDIPQGKAIGIVGPNGSGKTSLLNVINGFHQPTKGKIFLDSTDISRMSAEQSAKVGIGRVFQNFGIFKELTLYENLVLAYVKELSFMQKCLPMRYLPQTMKNRIDAMLRELDLYDKKNDLAASLSGGQMRLLEIGRLVLQDTKVYLLDEPTAGVSPKLKSKVIELIQKIVASGKTVVIVEHDFYFLSEFIDHLCVINDGKIALYGESEQVQKDPKLKEIYLGK